MTGDLRTRVEALREALLTEAADTDDPDWGKQVGRFAASLSAVLDADPDTPTSDASVDDGLVEQIAQEAGKHRLLGNRNGGYYRTIWTCLCGDDVMCGDHDEDPDLDEAWGDHVARALVAARPWQAEVEAARQDTLDAVIERADDGIEFGPKNCLLLTRIVTDVRERAARGETRQP